MSASTFGGFAQALIAAAKLNAGLTDVSRVATYRRALIASLERLQQAGCGPWVEEWIGVLADERCWLPIWEADGNDLVKLLGELLNMDEAAQELPPARSEQITPPPSGVGGEYAAEREAAESTRDTLPPIDGEAWGADVDLEKPIVPV